ncbi:hypothetical protein [uncultured Sphingomonas sp.]|uniref:hypothetical protein n=1 Tax=uncultured Sphingomonas sp. TaxID=158754 RepID=UPI0025DABD5C|nr:hypothetical protein [uncultured Sphingomonas sp.]
MATLLGNDYLGWFESATAGTYAALKGQGTYDENRSQPDIDTSGKDDAGYSTGSFGNVAYKGTIDVKVRLPDAVYTRIETAALAKTPIGFQLRKNGLAGVLADAVFAASVYVSITNRTFNKDGTVDVKIALSLAAAPTVDVLA